MRLYSHYSFLLHKHGYFTDYPPLRTDAKIRRNLYDCPLRDLFPPPYENSQRLWRRVSFKQFSPISKTKNLKQCSGSA